jgi:hypothetical protein
VCNAPETNSFQTERPNLSDRRRVHHVDHSSVNLMIGRQLDNAIRYKCLVACFKDNRDGELDGFCPIAERPFE